LLKDFAVRAARGEPQPGLQACLINQIELATTTSKQQSKRLKQRLTNACGVAITAVGSASATKRCVKLYA